MAETVVRRSMADLPEPIIHHILSFLSGDQAAQTTVLCKAWLNAWLTRPTLVFSSAFFFSKKKKRTKEICWRPPDRDELREYNNFVKYVERSFERYHKQKTSIDKIELEIDKGVFDWEPVIRRCIQVAAEDSVKNLKVSLCNRELPEILLFEAKSLVDLTLTQVKLVERSTEKIKPLDRLKRLSLNYVEFYDVPFERLHFLYTKLMFRKNQKQFHNSQQTKFWQRDLREVKVEIFQRGVIQSELGLDFILVGQGEQLEETLDCKDFLSFLRTRAPHWGMMIKFKLDWETN